jgi:hypothetical protein
VIAIVPECHFESGTESEKNFSHFGSVGIQHTHTVNSGIVQLISSNPSELGGLSAGFPAGPLVDSYYTPVYLAYL